MSAAGESPYRLISRSLFVKFDWILTLIVSPILWLTCQRFPISVPSMLSLALIRLSTYRHIG